MGTTMGKLAHGEREEFVMVCGEREFSEEVKEEWGQRHNPARLECVSGWQSAHKILEARIPAVILVAEQTAQPDGRTERAKPPALKAVVTLFAGYAPTVVVGSPEQQAGLQTLLAGGTVDFVTRAAGCLPVAMGLVERRLRRRSARTTRPLETEDHPEELEARDFGEILRHELNNPLTGILGNAELLLVELHRKKVPLPQQAEHRLETIATLAVRMRETVRRLSDEWKAQSEAMTRELLQPPS
jgi:signal transduction histidine kinase